MSVENGKIPSVESVRYRLSVIFPYHRKPILEIALGISNQREPIMEFRTNASSLVVIWLSTCEEISRSKVDSLPKISKTRYQTGCISISNTFSYLKYDSFYMTFKNQVLLAMFSENLTKLKYPVVDHNIKNDWCLFQSDRYLMKSCRCRIENDQHPAFYKSNICTQIISE